MKTGADVLCAALEAHGITTTFGLPGSQTIALHDAMRRSGIRFVLSTHELAAGFMANGYFRSSGRIAPVMTIPGPGFTWGLTAAAEALHDSVPFLHITAASPSADGRRYLQAIDQAAIARPLVKGVFRIDSADSITQHVSAAIALANEGEPGPVLLEYLPDVMQSPATLDGVTRTLIPEAPTSLPGDVISTVLKARRPLILAGQGAVPIADGLKQLATLLRAPVATTVSARGVLPEDDPHSLCFDLERGRVKVLNQMIEGVDCMLVLGCKLGYAGSGGFRLSIPQERVIRVDTSQEALDSTPDTKYALKLSVARFIRPLLAAINTEGASTQSEWTPASIEQWRSKLRSVADNLPEPRVGGKASTTSEFFRALREALPRNGIVVTDSGLHQQLLRRHFDVLAPRGLIIPSDFQSMGFGLPAAVGAAVAAKDRKVVVVMGDGGFAMSGLELLTAVRENIPLTVLILNDGKLGRIRNEQLAKYGQSADVDLLNPDFRGMARSMGARYFLGGEDNDAVLRHAVGHPGVTVVEVPVRDQGAIQQVRVRGLVRGTAHRHVGPNVVAALKRALMRLS